MAGYLTRELDLAFGGQSYRIQALKDLQQFDDPDDVAERAGISSAQWSLFGQPWPSGRVLAEHMAGFDVAGKRALELGCGLALASLVLARRGVDVTASDYHPLAGEFLRANCRANDLPEIPFVQLDWAKPEPGPGRFDLLIGSDILYERWHAELLAGAIERHAEARAEVVVTDPGRGNSNRFVRALKAQGFEVEERRMAFEAGQDPPYRGRLITARRG